MSFSLTPFCFTALAALTVCGVLAQGPLHDPEDRVIQYNASDQLADPVSVLRTKLARGEAKLEFEPAHGYLVSLLSLLDVPISSQGLVFSKTSLQTDRVSPRTPRAVYFNDDVYVSWVPGGDAIDISAVDPAKGPIFYTLDQTRTPSPIFARRSDCMQCHLGPKTLEVPGPLLRSVLTAGDGYPLAQVDGFILGHGCPIDRRWGGWYVTGSVSGDVHLGNSRADYDASRYLSPASDIVALMLLAHQVKMDNLITRANYEARFALDPQMAAQAPEWAKRRIANAAEPLLEYMLFRDEAILKGPVKGASTFAKEFEQKRPARFERALLARAGPQHPIDALPMQLSHLFGRIRRPAPRDERIPVAAVIRDSERRGSERGLRQDVERRPQGRAGDSAGHETGIRCLAQNNP